jgi:hypothetical protein
MNESFLLNETTQIKYPKLTTKEKRELIFNYLWWEFGFLALQIGALF